MLAFLAGRFEAVQSVPSRPVPGLPPGREVPPVSGGRLSGRRPMKHSTAGLEPDALVAELEGPRAELLRAERESRTYLVRRGVLDQTRLDLIGALKGIATGGRGGEP
jgi:hypothetical protein